jgi:hypothetical protein
MRTTSSAAILSTAILSLACATAGPPAPPAVVNGGFVAMLGNDTVTVERYIRTNSYVEGDVVTRAPTARITHYRATLGPQGQIMSFTSAQRAPNADPASPPIAQVTTSFGDTLALVEIVRAGKRDSVNSARKGFRSPVSVAMPTIPAPLGLYEALLAANPGKGSDSLGISLVGGGRQPNNTLWIWRRHGADSVLIRNTWSPDWYERLSIDNQGRITGGDWRGTTVKVLINRVDNVQFDVIAKGWAAQEAARGRPGPLSPTDSVVTSVAGANINIVYARPFARGRNVWADVVVPGVRWRLGANAATMFTTSRDLAFGNTVIPAGSYTLWMMPSESAPKLLVNSQTKQWGTEFDPAKDIAAIDLVRRAASPAVPEFTIKVEPQGSGGVMRFIWNDREYFVPFTVR